MWTAEISKTSDEAYLSFVRKCITIIYNANNFRPIVKATLIN